MSPQNPTDLRSPDREPDGYVLLFRRADNGEWVTQSMVYPTKMAAVAAVKEMKPIRPKDWRTQRIFSIGDTPVPVAGREQYETLRDEYKDAIIGCDSTFIRTKQESHDAELVMRCARAALDALVLPLLASRPAEPDPLLSKMERVTAVICWTCRSVTYTEDFYALANCDTCKAKTFALPLVFRPAKEDANG